MSDTYSNLNFHFVFSTKDRQETITATVEKQLYKILNCLTKELGGKMIEINGTCDHVHLLIRLLPRHKISDFMRALKAKSSRRLNKCTKCSQHFSWQAGYGVFSVSQSRVNDVQQYIEAQKQIHRSLKTEDEYNRLLKLNHLAPFEDVPNNTPSPAGPGQCPPGARQN